MEVMVATHPTALAIPGSRFRVEAFLPSVRTRSSGLLTLLTLTVLVGCGGSPKSATGPAPGGALAVQVSGLPAGTAARVTVTSPSGQTTAVTGSQLLTGLLPGTYAVSAGYVNAQNQTWTATLSGSSVAIAADDTATVLVAYTGGPATSLNLRISGVQLIQSTQSADGSVPMIAGRDALVRVFVTANGANQARPAARVRLFAGGAQVDSFTIGAPGNAVPTSVDTASLASSWNVLVPAARVAAGLALQVVLDPGDAIAETDESDNLWPGAVPQAVSVLRVPAFALRFVPVKQSANNLTGQVSDANKGAMADATLRMHPLGATTVDVRSAFTTDAPVLASDDNNGAWGRILGEIYALRNADGFQGDYVGVVQVTYGGGIAGLGYVGAPASVAWDKAASASGVVAHELGHNFGRSHAPCGNPSGPDPQYPYPNASIGTWGLDLPALALKAPGTYKDLMSYCNPDWISDYNYLAIANFRGTAAAVEPSGPASAAREGLMVWGRIQNGNVILEPSFAVTAPVQLPPRPGPNRVEGFDAVGRRVFSLSFEGTLVADLPRGEERHFAFVVPLSAVERAGLSAMQLTGDGLTVRRQGGAGLRAAPGPGPAVTRRGDELEVRWDPAYPLAIIRDARTGEILSFARNGFGRVPATGGAIKVELSEGVSSLPGVVLGAP
jgi:Peptidase M66